MKLDPPTEIPPYNSLTVSYQVLPGDPGPFAGQVHLFLSDGIATREHVVHLRGSAAP